MACSVLLRLRVGVGLTLPENRLWPYRVTQQKVARSWSTQVDLMERYPEHRFACSQAQQFKWLEEVYLLYCVHTVCLTLSLLAIPVPFCSHQGKGVDRAIPPRWWILGRE